MKNIIKKVIALTTLIIIISCVFLLTACDDKSRGRVVEEDTIFYIDRKNSSIKGIALNLLLNKNSCITLRKDGTATIHIRLMDGMGSALNYIAGDGALDDVEVEPVFFDLAEEYFPGFSVYDLPGTFQLLENALGLTLFGIDFEDPSIKDTFETLAETGKLPSTIELPDELGLEYNADYYIKDEYSKYSGKYTGVFMGAHHKNSQPFVLMDYKENSKNGKVQLSWINDIIDLKIYATQA